MARFKYNGEQVGNLGNNSKCTQIKIPKQDGTFTVINSPDNNGFVVGSDIGEDITDARSIRVLQADHRFTQLS